MTAAMEFAITAGSHVYSPADNSYKFCRGELHRDRSSNHFAWRNRRRQCPLFLSRFAAKELGPIFPYGTLFINIAGSLIVGFFVVWTTEKSRGPAVALAGRCRILRVVYHLLQLCV